MAIDKDRIAQYIETVERLLKDWVQFSKTTTLAKLKKDRKHCLFVCYTMQGAIQTVLDIVNHIIAAHAWPRPMRYRECFEILGRENFIQGDIVKKLTELSRFRNILVHRYPNLNIKKILPHVQQSWKPLKEFIKIVARKSLK